MSDPAMWASVSVAAVIGLTILAVAALKGWRDWIGLQRLAIEGRRNGEGRSSSPTGARIELADLKERVRKLEAIAAGVDL